MTQATYAGFVTGRCKLGDGIRQSITGDQLHLVHMAMGISGECGEVVLAVRNGDRRNLKEEAGDVLFYAQGMANGLGVEWDATNVLTVPRPDTTCDDLVICAGNIVDAVKKVAIYQKTLDASVIVMLLNEIVQHLKSIIAQHDLTIKGCIEDNVEKLSIRYHEGRYTDKQAQERADK